MSAMALALPGMLACVLAEAYFLRRQRGTPIPWRDIVLNLDSGHILMWFFRGIEIAVCAWVLRHANLHWVERWPPVARWIFALFAWDLGFYWMHRLHHVFPALWSVHVVHHEGEHFSLSLGIRNAWISSLTTLPFTSIPLALAGVPLDVFIVVSTLHYTVQFYNHNGIVGQSGWLERFFVTPVHHRVHHGQNHAYRDRNFGGTFLLWDRLFGSFQPGLPGVPVRYGVSRPTPSINPFWANVAPVLHYLGARTPWLGNATRAVASGRDRRGRAAPVRPGGLVYPSWRALARRRRGRAAHIFRADFRRDTRPRRPVGCTPLGTALLDRAGVRGAGCVAVPGPARFARHRTGRPVAVAWRGSRGDCMAEFPHGKFALGGNLMLAMMVRATMEQEAWGLRRGARAFCSARFASYFAATNARAEGSCYQIALSSRYTAFAL